MKKKNRQRLNNNNNGNKYIISLNIYIYTKKRCIE